MIFSRFPISSLFSKLSLVTAALILTASLSLTGCGDRGIGSGSKAVGSDTAQSLFTKAQNAEKGGNMITASELYTEIDRRFPYSPLALKAQIRTAFVLYKAERYDEAVAAADRFIQLHPGHPSVPYAYYLRGLTEYDQISDVGRDQGHTVRAKELFEELVRRFPKSQYSKDARGKIDLTVDQLAGKEMEVGRFYQDDKHYLAAIKRYKAVVQDFERTNHVREALHRLTECYLALGVDQEAQSAAAVLGNNYPKSSWYRESYKLLRTKNLKPKAHQGSWLGRTFR